MDKEEEIKKLQQELLQARQNNQDLAEAHLRLRQHSLEMHRALSFYAADSNYPEVLDKDRGKLARSVLARVVMNR